MDVHTRIDRVITCAAVAAPVADVTGRLLAPSLLATAPVVVVVLSPADPHLLLAASESRIVLVAIAFAVRLGRAWAIFRSVDHLARRDQHSAVRRLLLPERRNRWRHHTGIGAVVLLPGMIGALVAARAQIRPRLFLGVAACSTAAGLALTLTAAHIFDEQLARATVVLTSHPAEFTLLVGTAVLVSLLRRARKQPAIPRAPTRHALPRRR